MANKKEIYEHIGKIIAQESIEREKNIVYPKNSIMPELYGIVKKMGCNCEASFQLEYFCLDHQDEMRDIVLGLYRKCEIEEERTFLMSCLYHKKNSSLIPFFLDEFHKNHSTCSSTSMFMDVLANNLLITASKEYKEEYLKILNDSSFSDADHDRILWTLRKIKTGIEIPTVLRRLENKCCINACLLDLSVYKNPEFLPIFEKYVTYTHKDKTMSNSDTRNIARNAIKKIEKMKKEE